VEELTEGDTRDFAAYRSDEEDIKCKEEGSTKVFP